MNRYTTGENQKRYFELYQKWPYVANNTTSVLHYKGEIESDIFQNALKRVQNNHPIMRSVLNKQKGGLFIETTRDSVPISCFDIQTDKDIDFYKVLKSRAIHNNNTVFNVSSWPVYKIEIHRRNKREGAILITFNHCMIDAYSHFAFARESLLAYNNMKNGLQVKKIDYSPDLEFVMEKQDLASHKTESKIDFWKSVFNSEEKKLTSIKSIRKFEMHTLSMSLDESYISLLSSVAKDFCTNIASLLIILYVKSLALCDQSETVVLKEVISKRNKRNIRHFNCLINLVPLIIPSSITHKPIHEMITDFKLIREKYLSLQLPYWYLTKMISRDLYLHPYGICGDEFNFIPSSSTNFEGGDHLKMAGILDLSPRPNVASFDRCLNVSIGLGGKLYLELLYNSDTVNFQKAEKIVNEIKNDIDSFKHIH
jgi:Condensation domain